MSGAKSTGARALADRVAALPGVRASVIDGSSAVGGGSAPGHTLPTRLVSLAVRDESASSLLARLRLLDPPVIARIVDDCVVLDVRTVLPDEDEPLISALLGLESTQG
jgi:L-seryl-tRNA(Ser) seleniumtransferase